MRQVPAVKVTGEIIDTPRLSHGKQGNAYLTFTIRHQPIAYDSKGIQVKKPSSYFRCHVWRRLAENCSKTLKNGDLVLVCGELLPPTEFEDNDGYEAFGNEIRCEEVAIDMSKLFVN